MQELLQTGAEFFNDPSALCDAELVALAMESLDTLGIHGFRVDLGQCEYVASLLSEDESLLESDRAAIQRHISRKDALALEEYMAFRSCKKEVAQCAKEVCMLFGDYSHVLEKAGRLCLNSGMQNALSNLREIASLIEGQGFSAQICLDLGFSNWMDYYSGMIFKIYAENASQEVVSGGRYDSLASRLGHKKYACGFGHHLDLTLPLATPPKGSARLVRILAPKADFRDALLAASQLRRKGYSVEAAESAGGFVADFGTERLGSVEALQERLGRL
jgi:ATP phosphoribosyltransferase regulatory subunit